MEHCSFRQFLEGNRAGSDAIFFTFTNLFRGCSADICGNRRYVRKESGRHPDTFVIFRRISFETCQNFSRRGQGEVRTVSGEELIADDAVSSSPSEELLDFGVSEEEVLTVDEPVFEGEFEDESEEDIVTESQSVNSARAVFYEDSSQLIDYSSEKGIIDPDFDHYREIKRIDEGSLVLEKEGLTFYCGKKLFRFDFIKAEKIYFSRNSIAVVYRTGSPVRLFLLPNETVLADIAREAYKEFLESRSAKK